MRQLRIRVQHPWLVILVGDERTKRLHLEVVVPTVINKCPRWNLPTIEGDNLTVGVDARGRQGQAVVIDSPPAARRVCRCKTLLFLLCVGR